MNNEEGPIFDDMPEPEDIRRMRNPFADEITRLHGALSNAIGEIDALRDTIKRVEAARGEMRRCGYYAVGTKAAYDAHIADADLLDAALRGEGNG